MIIRIRLTTEMSCADDNSQYEKIKCDIHPGTKAALGWSMQMAMVFFCVGQEQKHLPKRRVTCEANHQVKPRLRYKHIWYAKRAANLRVLHYVVLNKFLT